MPVLSDKVLTTQEFYQKLTCKYAPNFYNQNDEFKGLCAELRTYEKEKGLEGKLLLKTFALNCIKDLENINVLLVSGYITDKSGISRRSYKWFEVPDAYVANFTKKECQYTVKQTDEDIFITNEFGCSWNNGVGCNPNGCFCGECTNITHFTCPGRNEKD